jgi:Family of unknown function (DUF6603)
MADALQSILSQAALALAPLRAIKTADQATAFFRKLGYEIPAGAFGSELSTLSSDAGELIDAVRQLITAKDDAATATAIAKMFTRLEELVGSIERLHDQIKAGGGSAIANIEELPRRLTDFLVLDFLDRQRPETHATLHLLGLIEYEPAPARGQPMRLINWDRFPRILSDPMRIANDTYRWETDFDFDTFLVRLDRMMRATALPGGIYPQSEAAHTALGNTSANLRELRFPIFQKGFTAETYSQFGITFSPAEALNGKKKGFALLPYLMGATAFDFAVCDRGQLTFKSNAEITGVGIVVRPPLNAESLLNVTTGLNASINISEKPEKAEELILFGSPGATRFAVQGLGINWFVAEPQGKLDLGVQAQIQAVRLVIDGGDADGFLEKILSGVHVKAEASANFGMTLLTGFTFSGGAKLALEIPAHIELGPITIQSLRLGLQPANDHIRLEAGAVFSFALGPLQVVIQDVGLRTDLEFHPGNIGPANLEIGFKPPTGGGVKVDSPFVTGGGFLFFDSDQGQYGGVLQLNVEGITVTAIGLITTRLPNGAKGFSFVVIITAQGFNPIQLGLGFALTKIGGLLAINRTCDQDFLRDGLKNNTLKDLLSPNDPIANAPQIFGTLNKAFPPQEGSYLFGPVVQICWGTPALLTMDLALILELGRRTRLLILGRIAALLPTEKEDLIRLQMNALGVIDFDQSSISIDAVLYDSRLVHKFPLTGSMAMRLNWGSSPVFALSVGGFHPAFRPPPGFPALARISISFSDTSDFRLRAEGYFAITANTMQWGAKAELFAKSGGFSVEGHIGYDVLIQFDPFGFVADFSAGVQLKHGSTNLFKLQADGELAGPRPLHVKGKVTFEIFWCDFTISFNRMLISGEAPPPPAPIVVMDRLQAALRDPANWSGQLAESRRRLVTISDSAASGVVGLHPLAQLAVKQKVVPLEVEIAKFGDAKPADANRFNITGFSVNESSVHFDRVRDFFAPAQFLNLSDDEKLTAPSFEPMVAGVSAGDDSFIFTGDPEDIISDDAIVFETIILDKANDTKSKSANTFSINPALLINQIFFGAAARSDVRLTGTARYSPALSKNSLANKGWTVASTQDGSPQAAPGLDAGQVVSYSESFQALEKMKQENPAKAKMLMLIRVPVT